MKNLSVVNKKFTNGSLYVGRPSPLGNPFVIGKDGDRSTVIKKYRHWLWTKIQQGDQKVIGELNRIKDLALAGKEIELACWCAPEPCHGDAIKRCVEWMAITN